MRRELATLRLALRRARGPAQMLVVIRNDPSRRARGPEIATIAGREVPRLEHEDQAAFIARLMQEAAARFERGDERARLVVLTGDDPNDNGPTLDELAAEAVEPGATVEIVGR
jgi:hypothetical protein